MFNSALSPVDTAFPSEPSRFTVNGALLEIQGTLDDDTIRVWETANKLKASIGDETFSIKKSKIKRLLIWGHQGDDDIDNMSSMRSTIWGGANDDRIRGGSNSDRLGGNGGNDRIWGREGNDLIIGSKGNDRLWGGSGQDRLYGNDGVDRLHGEGENDKVYGGNHRDYLHGGSGSDLLDGGTHNDVLHGDGQADTLSGGLGNDQLHGGRGKDHLRGGDGQDRLYGGAHRDRLVGGRHADHLFGQGSADTIFGDENDRVTGGSGPDRLLTRGNTDLLDKSKQDATIRFKDGKRERVNFFSGRSIIVAKGSFSNQEIQQTDEAFETMYRATGHLRALRLANGRDLTFYRQGEIVAGSGSIAAWNLGSRSIHLPNAAFNSGDAWFHQIVIHEIGHIYDGDLPRENPLIGEFRQQSGWQYNPTTLQWTHDPQKDNFVRAYGKSNAYEDWATAFAAYFMARTQWGYQGGPGAKAAPHKMAIIKTFLKDLNVT